MGGDFQERHDDPSREKTRGVSLVEKLAHGDNGRVKAKKRGTGTFNNPSLRKK